MASCVLICPDHSPPAPGEHKRSGQYVSPECLYPTISPMAHPPRAYPAISGVEKGTECIRLDHAGATTAASSLGAAQCPAPSAQCAQNLNRDASITRKNSPHNPTCTVSQIPSAPWWFLRGAVSRRRSTPCERSTLRFEGRARAWDSRLVQGSGFRVQGSGCRVQGAGCRVQGSGLKVQGPGFRVWGQTSGRAGGSSRRCSPACRWSPSFSKRVSIQIFLATKFTAQHVLYW